MEVNGELGQYILVQDAGPLPRVVPAIEDLLGWPGNRSVGEGQIAAPAGLQQRRYALNALHQGIELGRRSDDCWDLETGPL